MKRIILSIFAIFVALTILDFVVHGLILYSDYAATAQLWRPMNEIKVGILYLDRLVVALAFVSIYARFFRMKNLRNSMEFGFWFGLATAVPMGFGSYSVIPMPFEMALTWFIGSLIEALTAGLIVGLIVKE